MHYDDATMGVMASQITSLAILYSTVYSGADQRKHQSSASLAFVRGIHRGPMNSSRKGPVTRKMFPFDDVIMERRHYKVTPLSLAGRKPKISPVNLYSWWCVYWAWFLSESGCNFTQINSVLISCIYIYVYSYNEILLMSRQQRCRGMSHLGLISSLKF